ncbi:uncharacterized protein METZ01_LOCUS68143, partial [marine metagenome]
GNTSKKRGGYNGLVVFDRAELRKQY